MSARSWEYSPRCQSLRALAAHTAPALTKNAGIQRFDGSFVNCIKEANGSAAALVNLVVENIPCFRDEACFDSKTVRFYKRAQILVADLWACFEGEGYGDFHDIDTITMFAGMYIYSHPLGSSHHEIF